MSRIRVARPSDARAMLEIYRPLVESTAISFETEPPTLQDMADRVRRTLETHPWLVWEEAGGEVVGFAYATPYRARPAYGWSTEVSVYVQDGSRGRGIGEALYGELLRILEAQGFATALAAIALPNPASVALHERLGFEPVGVLRRVGFKLGRWHDVEWWQRPLRVSARPEPPVPFPLLLAEVEG